MYIFIPPSVPSFFPSSFRKHTEGVLVSHCFGCCDDPEVRYIFANNLHLCYLLLLQHDLYFTYFGSNPPPVPKRLLVKLSQFFHAIIHADFGNKNRAAIGIIHMS
jgi:hypothetical protein